MSWFLLVWMAAPAELDNKTLVPAQLDAAARVYFAKGDLPSAAAVWRRVVELSPADTNARYDLVRSLVLLRRQGKACEYGASAEQILGQLALAVADPAILARFRVDPDMADLRAMVRAQVLLGADLTERATRTRLLTGTTFWGAGSNGLQDQLTFLADSSLVVVHPTDVSAARAYTPSQGVWKMADERIVALVPDAPEQYLRLTGEGTLVIDDGTVMYRESRAECP